MSVIKPEDRMVHKLIEMNKKLDRVTELLVAMNGNLTSIKANTQSRTGGIMGR